jgi:hypothetical protein
MTAPPTGSAAFTWRAHPKLHEVFYFISGQGFDVDKAKAILRKRPRDLGQLTVEGAAYYLGRHIKARVTTRTIDNFDLAVPLIIATLPKGELLVIDGWHRIAKADQLKVETLPCVILDATETKTIRT